MGFAFRWLLSRARPADKTEGTMLEAGPQGRSADGGWLARKGLPPAAELSKLMVWIGVATLVLVSASRAAAVPKRREVRRSPRRLKRGNSYLMSHRSP